MSNVENRQVNIYINDAQAAKSLSTLEAKSKTLAKAIEEGQAAGKKMTKEIEELGKTKSKIELLEGVVSGKLRPSMQMMTTEVERLRRELSGMSADNPKYAASFEEYKKKLAIFNEMKTQVGGVKQALRSMWEEVKTVALGVVIGNTIQSAMQSIGGYISNMFTGNAKLSDELAKIEKATGLSAAGVRQLNTELGKIDTRTSKSALRDIAVGLGQIGEAANATNVAALDRIVVALGDEFGGNAQEITNSLSVLRNNLDDIKSGNYAEDVTHIGNALNELGATGLATAPVVTDIANRVSGVARTFGISSGAILGMAATFQELGIQTERGSTAYVKIIQKIASEPQKFAAVVKAAGMDVKQFYTDVQTNMQKAFITVAAAARKAGDSNAAFGKILKDLDTDGAGVSELLSKMAANQEMLAKKTEIASKALGENSSIMNEFDKLNNNMAANLEKLSKNISSWFTNSSISDFLGNIVKGLVHLTTASKEVNEQFEEQLTKVTSLEKNAVPLINRYDELSAKAEKLGGVTKLSAAEQAEMKSIVNQVATAMPFAITKFDEYGNAVSISTGRVREFIEAEQARLKMLAGDSIKKYEKDLLDAHKKRIAAWDKTREIALTGTFVIEEIHAGGGTGGAGASSSKRKATEAEVAAKIEEHRQLLELEKGYQAELSRLKGDYLGDNLKAQEAAAKAAKDKAEKERLEALNKAKHGIPLNDEDRKKIDEEAEKAREKLAKVREELVKLENELGTSTYSEYEKAVAKINDRYTDLQLKLIDAGGSLEDFNKLNKLKHEELASLQQSYQEKLNAFLQENDNAREEAAMSAFDKEVTSINKIFDAQEKLFKGHSDALVKLEIERQERLREARIKFSHDQKDENGDTFDDRITGLIHGSSVGLPGITRPKSKKEQDEEDKKEKEKWDTLKKKAKEYLSYAQQAMSLMTMLSNFQRAIDEAELTRFKKAQDEKLESLQHLKDQKILSEEQYSKKKKEIDEETNAKEREMKRKQAESDKLSQMFQTVINTASAVVEALPNIPLSVFVGAMGAVQLGLIAATPIPEFAQGGFIPQGPSHKEGGISLVSRGRKLGEIEGGEPIYSKRFYNNNRSFMDSLMAYSHSTGGAPLSVGWMHRPVTTINAPSISGRLNRLRMFEQGGILPGGNAASGLASGGSSNREMKEMMRTIQQLNSILDKGIWAKTLLSENEYQQARMDDIRASGTITR